MPMEAKLHISMLACLIVAGVPPGLSAELRVPADHATIQSAVDSATSGDTIHIAAGIYVEQVRILQKNLSLIGQPGTILRAFPGMLSALPPNDLQRCILRIDEFSFVTIRNLTFEGDQLAGQNAPALIGVNYDLSGGSVEHCRFTGFREKTPGAVQGLAIKFWNGFSYASRYPAKISGTTIEDSYGGIEITGATGFTSYDATVVDNTISGVGPSSANYYMIGVQLNHGVTGELVRNTISGFSHIGSGNSGAPLAFAILGIEGYPDNLMPLLPLTFAENVLRSNQVHLALFLGDKNVIRNNTFEGTAPGTRPAGVWFSGESVRVEGNVFRDMEEGIRVGGEDPTYGTDLGIATNAMLVDNSFCSVTTSVNTQPQASATEQGTLFCPPPDPSLTISWPVIYEGFSLQTSPAPSGPWTTSEAAIHQQGVKNTVVLPAGSDEQFFRLAKP